MATAASVAIGLIALAHVWFLVLEMFLWRTPFGRKTFKMTEEVAERTAPLAANQGLYNGFLAAGLAWSLVSDGAQVVSIKFFFLTCVLIAGLFGGATASRAIFVLQALPAAIALALLFAGR